MRPLGFVEAGVGDGNGGVLGEEAEGPQVVLGECPVRAGVHVEDTEHLAPVDQWHREGAVDGGVLEDEVLEPLPARRTGDQQGLALLGDVAGDALTQLDDGALGVDVASHADSAQLVGALEEHDRAAVGPQQFESAGQNDVEDLGEVEDGIDGLADRHQRGQLLDSVRQGCGQDPLVEQETGQTPEMDLLLQDVQRESHRDQHETDPHRQVLEQPGGVGPRRGHEHQARGQSSHDDNGHHPELPAPALDSQADDLGLPRELVAVGGHTPLSAAREGVFRSMDL